MYQNLFYFYRLNDIGGIETFLYTIAQKYGKDHDIIVVYNDGAQPQIDRLKKLVRTVKFNGQHFKCRRAFFNYNTDIIDYVEAEDYYLTLHGDYKALHLDEHLPLHPKITKYLGVSQRVCDVFEECSGLHAESSYNPVLIREPKKILHLISACRLTPEKGKNRMKILADILDKHGVPFIWQVFTNDKDAIDNPSIIYRKPNLDIIDYIADADYLVQLSDTEGYSYSVIESLCVGTPVIITEIPALLEMDVVNGKNAWVVPFDMSNVPVDDICKGLPPFKYTPRPDRWGELLAPGPSTYLKDLKTMVKIKIDTEYYDLELKRLVTRGEEIEVNKIRAEYLESCGLVAKEKNK